MDMAKPKGHNRGLMGVGTLIIFIAIILVAAVAAVVLISVAGSLQQRALLTGGQTEEGVSTGAEIYSVMALDAGDGSHDVENFEVLMRLQPGSSTINLNNSVITLDTATTTQNLDYNGTGTAAVSETDIWIAEYVKQGPDYEEGYLARGDVVKARFTTTNSIGENEEVRIKFIPRVGTITPVEFVTPDVMTDTRESLWP